MLNKVAQRHNDWVRMVQSFGEVQYAEDIVQEMYLKLHRYIENETLKEETVNTYVWLILRSLFIDLKRHKQRFKKVGLDEWKPLEFEDNSEQEKAYGRLLKQVDLEMNEWYWYDRDLFKLYISSPMSIREMSKATKISTSNIFTTIKRCKQKIKEAVGEDYIDFKHEDYERL